MLGSNLFDTMPSFDKTNMRVLSVPYEEFERRFKESSVLETIKRYGFHIGFSRDYYVTIAMPLNCEGDIPQARAKLQELLNELDRNTDIYIQVRYDGNCGQFAEKNIYDDSVCGSKTIENEIGYNFLTFHSLRNIMRGAKHAVSFSFNSYDWKIKGYEKSTEIKYTEIKDDLLRHAKDFAKKFGCIVELSQGKRGCDSESDTYEAFVCYRGKVDAYNQLGSFVINQNKFGDCSICVNVPLCGSHGGDFDIQNYKAEIEKVLKGIL